MNSTICCVQSCLQEGAIQDWFIIELENWQTKKANQAWDSFDQNIVQTQMFWSMHIESIHRKGIEDVLRKDQLHGEGGYWRKIYSGQKQPSHSPKRSQFPGPSSSVSASSFLCFHLDATCIVNLWLSHQSLYQTSSAVSTELQWVCHQPQRCKN